MEKARLNVNAAAKKKAMEAAMAGFQKEFGSVLVSGDKNRDELIKALMHVDVISTGSLSLDSALGVWGFPRSRVIELYGKEHSGKTSIALQAAGCCQKMGGTVLFVDVEQALDALFCMKNGCDYGALNHVKPNSGEEAMNIVDYWLKKNCEVGFPLVDMIIVDSVAALVTEGQINEEIGKVDIAIGARLLSQTLRKLTPFLTGCAVIFINQMRDKPGVMFGSHEDTPGGRALKYYASVRCNVTKASALYITDKGSIVDYNENNKGKKIREVGRRVKITIEKNKVAPKSGPAEFDFVESIGIIRSRELMKISSDYGYVTQNGAHYSLPNGKKFHGGDALAAYFDEDPTAEQPLLEHVQKVVMDSRRKEIDRAIAKIEKRSEVFDMWKKASSTAPLDVLDDDDKPPQEDVQEAGK